MEQFPGLASQMTPDVAVESMMQLANVFRGRWDERKKWGYHMPSSWQLFFDVRPRDRPDHQGDFKMEDVVKNDYIDAANSFDAAKVKADADGFALSDAYNAVNVEEIAKRI
jgi:NitT/TauT family transport system substrate-binding protein